MCVPFISVRSYSATGDKLVCMDLVMPQAFSVQWYSYTCTGHFIMFSMITNIYNKKTKGPTLMKLFTATGKLKKFFSLTTRGVRLVHHG